MAGGRVEFHANLVHAGDDHVVEGSLQRGLIDIVLVLADSDRFGIEFYEFRERIHESAADRDGPPHRDVVVGELLAGDLARRVDGGAALAHHHDGNGGRELELFYEGLRLARGSAVADGDRLDLVKADHVQNGLGRLHVLAAAPAGVDDLVGEEFSLAVEEDDLASRAESGIDAEGDLLAERRSKEKLAEVVGEDTDRLLVGFLFVKGACLHFHGKSEKALEAVVTGKLHLLGGGGVPAHKKGVERPERLGFRRGEACVEESFRFPATHRENPVGGGGRRRFAPVEVVFELGPLLLLARDERRFDHSFVQVEAAKLGACRGVVVDPFGKDVPRPGKNGRHRVDGRGLGIHGDRVPDKGCGQRLRIGRGILCPEGFGQGLQAEFLRDGRPRALPRLEGKIDILERVQRGGTLHLGTELLGEEFPLL